MATKNKVKSVAKKATTAELLTKTQLDDAVKEALSKQIVHVPQAKLTLVSSEPPMQQLTSAIVLVAEQCSRLSLTQMPAAVGQLKSLKVALEDTIDSMSSMVVKEVAKKGTQIEDTKSREYNGIRIKPHRTTFDPKKVEALLRSKGKEPSRYMDVVTTFAVNQERATAITFVDGIPQPPGLTVDELETCRYETTWVLDLKNSNKGEQS